VKEQRKDFKIRAGPKQGRLTRKAQKAAGKSKISSANGNPTLNTKVKKRKRRQRSLKKVKIKEQPEP